ncbi:MAG: glucosylceramidase [Candidatus Cellulosilyticum pullistercoris]|uniref:Glucosylceramidase n=1 Tax=Candidatus Cellulosilyticum pullistercoris TaxID=2838521 RepID=A0A9E2KBD2_9FIRM|nr:glucosylceramidase [Candidatus Cellulosilyticum pullistercoris]
MSLRIITTNENTNMYLQEMTSLPFLNETDVAMEVINVYPEVTYQTIVGFGGAFTEATAYNILRLPEEKQAELIKDYFGEEGIGYNLCRMHINSCDFALDNYAYVDNEKDTEFATFSIERDRKYIIPIIKKAQEISKESISFLASPWSPPGFMKTTGEMNHGGKLKPEYRTAWARYIAKYIKTYKEEGIEISRITVQNEPEAIQTWDSCIYTAEDEMIFVRDYLGPIFEEEGLQDVKIFIWDHNKERLYERTRDVVKDEKANQYVAGVGFHWYTGDHFEAIQMVRERYPEKELLFTEGCVEYSRFAEANAIQKAHMYAHDIIGNFNAGMNGYIDWNMVLDYKGGPNHVGNFCDAPIMCSETKDSYEKRLTFYYIGHFSKYIKKGAKRIATTKYTADLDVVGFMNPDGEKIIVVLNRTAVAKHIALREEKRYVDLEIAPEAIYTLIYN